MTNSNLVNNNNNNGFNGNGSGSGSSNGGGGANGDSVSNSNSNNNITSGGGHHLLPMLQPPLAQAESDSLLSLNAYNLSQLPQLNLPAFAPRPEKTKSIVSINTCLSNQTDRLTD